MSCPFLPPHSARLLTHPGSGRGAGRPEGFWSPHLFPPVRPMSSYATDDDIVFEDFARLRLKGMKDEDYEDQFC